MNEEAKIEEKVEEKKSEEKIETKAEEKKPVKVKKATAKKATAKKATAKKATAKKSVKAAKKVAKKPVKHPREEPSERQKMVLSVLKVGKALSIADIGLRAFKSQSKFKQNSWTRNQLRWLRDNKYVKRVIVDGHTAYKRLA